MNIDGIGFQGIYSKNGVEGKNNKNKSQVGDGTADLSSSAGVSSSSAESDVNKVQEFYLKFKAGVLTFEELCSRLESLGVELQYEKDAEGNNIGISFKTQEGSVYCSATKEENNATNIISDENNTTVEEIDENGLVVTKEKRSDGSLTITKKDKNGNLVEVEERNADNQLEKLTLYNKAGRVECTKEYEYNEDGSYIETVKNGSRYVVKKTEISADGKTLEDLTPENAKSILKGQLFVMEDIIDAGFNSVDIIKHFAIVGGNDGNFYYEIKTDAGESQSLDDFYSSVMKQKADEVIAKYESGSITFAEIIQEMKNAGLTGITGNINTDGTNSIVYQCGNQTYTIEDTSFRDINKAWLECLTNGDSVKSFTNTLEKYKEVSDIEYSKTDYGSEKITFKFNGILQTFVSIPQSLDFSDKEEDK